MSTQSQLERIERATGFAQGSRSPRVDATPPVPTPGTVTAADQQAAAPVVAPAAPRDPHADLRRAVLHDVALAIGSGGATAELPEPELRDHVRSLALRSIEAQGVPLARVERARILEELTDEMLGYGPLQPLLADDTISEVMVNGHDEVWIERAGQLELTDVEFADEDHLLRIIDRIVSQVGRRIDEASPMVDARLPDGSRVNAIIPPLALRGPYMTIRKFRADPLTVKDLIDFGTLTPKSAKFLELAVQGGANVLISGGTGTGKTTTLNVLSAAIPDGERIVTIEDAAELKLAQRHVLPMESRPANIEGRGTVAIRDLLRNCLRMRPDRIIVGECRGPEAVDMLQAMNTGHDGSMTTIHANAPRDAIARLETLVLTSGVELPQRAIREQIASAFDVIVQLERLVDGTRRITAITEVVGMEDDTCTLQEIFRAAPLERSDADGRLLGPLAPTGVVPGFLDKLRVRRVEVPVHLFQNDSGEVTLRARAAKAAKAAKSR